jgi:hypothetical protein
VTTLDDSVVTVLVTDPVAGSNTRRKHCHNAETAARSSVAAANDKGP